MKLQLLACSLAIALVGSVDNCPASIVVYDLNADWSDTLNPNGVWAYKEGNNLLPHVDAFAFGLGEFDVEQPAWARSANGPDRLPAWFKAVAKPIAPPGNYDWEIGDIVLHTTDQFNGLGGGVGNVTWTSPISGVIDVSGHAWQVRDIGRSNRWALSLNSTLLSTGDLFSGDPFDRDNPYDFANGTGGASVLSSINVDVGDVLRLDIYKNSPAPGDFVGVNLTVLHDTVPEPSGVAIWALTSVICLGCVIAKRRMRPKL